MRSVDQDSGVSNIDERRRLGARPSRWLILPALLLLVVFAAGFVQFVRLVPEKPARASLATLEADAIVVLTGAASRIEDAVALLAAGHAKRLLITGVYTQTSRAALVARWPQYTQQFSCCIDIDRKALNTVGNATETASWARDRQYTGVILVTSDYHMPRSLLEFARQMPNIKLTPYAVTPVYAGSHTSWPRVEFWRLLLVEYVKYLAALGRGLF